MFTSGTVIPLVNGYQESVGNVHTVTALTKSSTHSTILREIVRKLNTRNGQSRSKLTIYVNMLATVDATMTLCG